MELKNRSFQYGKYWLAYLLHFLTGQCSSSPSWWHRGVFFLYRNTPDFISPMLWPPNSPNLNPVDYEVWGVLQQRVYHSRIHDVDHLKQTSRSGAASTRTSLTEQFDSGMFNYACVSVQTAATLSTNCMWCFCIRTAKATFPYWKLLFLSSIFKTAVAQKLCNGFRWNLQRLHRTDDN